MREAITDTGPVLHLHEIGRQECLGIFDSLVVPELVVKELLTYGIDPSRLGIAGLSVTVLSAKRAEWERVIRESDQPTIHPADAQVFVLARSSRFQKPVLTDDLALRRRLESQEATVVGSVGILVRAYTDGRLSRSGLESAIDALFAVSTLRMSRAFRAYVRQLLNTLPG